VIIILLALFIFLPHQTLASNVPPIDVPTSNYLVGSFYFSNWHFDIKDESNNHGWLSLENFPERKPLLGYYDDGNPDVADWQIKWATEHGVNFFIFLWTRCNKDAPTNMLCSRNLGKPIDSINTSRQQSLDNGFLHAQYKNKMKFTVMINGGQGTPTVNSVDDLKNNVMPYLINTYFKDPSYLVIDNKPVLYVWDDAIIEPTHGQEAVAAMRAAVKSSGFTDLILIGNDWGFVNRDVDLNQKLKDFGYDYSFNYTTWVVSIIASSQTYKTGLLSITR